jgi:hypothetical protein
MTFVTASGVLRGYNESDQFCANSGEEMKRKTTLTALAVLVLSTLACRLFAGDVQPLSGDAPTAAPLPAPSSGGEACIIGTWEMKGFEQYMAAAFPPDVESLGQLTYEGSSGRLTYTFSGDNRASIQAEALTVRYKLDMSGLNVELEALVEGSGSANYSATDGQLSLTNVATDTLTLSVYLAGALLVPATPLTGIFPESESDSSIAYTCNGNSMILIMPASNSLPVVLERISP